MKMEIKFKNVWIFVVVILLLGGVSYFTSFNPFSYFSDDYKQRIDSLKKQNKRVQEKVDELQRRNRGLKEKRQQIQDSLQKQRQKSDSLRQVEKKIEYDRQSNIHYLSASIGKLDSFWSNTRFFVK